MKLFKKLMVVLVAVIMSLTLTTRVMADETETYTITIDNAVVGEKYRAYKIFDVTYSGDNETPGALPDAPASDVRHFHNAYSYTIVEGSTWWSTVVGTAAPDETTGVITANGLTFTPTNEKVDGKTVYSVQATENFKPQDFATLLNKATKSETGDFSKTADKTSIDIPVTSPGYYFVDTTLGSLCSLDTTEPTAIIREKNVTTSQDKVVQEDSNNAWGDKNDADYGQVVNYKSTVTIGAHQKNVVFHDVMSSVLTLDKDNILVTGSVPAGKYTIITSGETLPEGDTFAVKFDDAWTQSLTEAATVTIEYHATLTTEAELGLQSGKEMGKGNDNQSKVTYGNAQTTEWDWTRTYVWEFDIFKYTGTDKTPLKDAKFNLKKGNSVLAFVLVSEGQPASEATADAAATEATPTVYRLATSSDITTTTELVTPENGLITIQGLDADTYVLTETDAPKGYNKLKEDLTIVVESNTTESGQDGTKQAATMTLKVDNKEANQVEVLNETGAELPSTGGIGTTIFHIAGAALVLGAGILLISKKRMNNN